MRRRALLISLLAVVAAALAVPALAATKTVGVGDNYFVRSSNDATIRIKAGDRIRFRNRGDSPHNATVRRGPTKPRTGTIDPGESKTLRFSRRGTYRVVCTIHPPDQRLKVVVS